MWKQIFNLYIYLHFNILLTTKRLLSIKMFVGQSLSLGNIPQRIYSLQVVSLKGFFFYVCLFIYLF